MRYRYFCKLLAITVIVTMLSAGCSASNAAPAKEEVAPEATETTVTEDTPTEATSEAEDTEEVTTEAEAAPEEATEEATSKEADTAFEAEPEFEQVSQTTAEAASTQTTAEMELPKGVTIERTGEGTYAARAPKEQTQDVAQETAVQSPDDWPDDPYYCTFCNTLLGSKAELQSEISEVQKYIMNGWEFADVPETNCCGKQFDIDGKDYLNYLISMLNYDKDAVWDEAFEKLKKENQKKR